MILRKVNRQTKGKGESEMKKFPLFSVVLLCVGILFVQVSPAQDYTRRNLPVGSIFAGWKNPRQWQWRHDGPAVGYVALHHPSKP